MVFAMNANRGRSIWPVAILFLLLVISLLLLARLVNDAELLGRYQLWLLGFNLLLLFVFTVLAVINFGRLAHKFFQHRPGSRLATKLAILFMLFALVPATIVYTFSTWIISGRIDSWFNIEVDSALQSAIDLSRNSLAAQLKQYHRQLQPLVQELENAPDDVAAYLMNTNIELIGASELLLLGSDKRIITSVSADVAAHLLPDLPSDAVFSQIASGEPYLGVDPTSDGNLHARLVFPLPSTDATAEERILQVLYPMPQSANTAKVQKTYKHYSQLSFLRSNLKQHFIIVLTLVLLSAVVYAIWVALFSTKRLMHPILKLTLATQAVAVGELDTRISASPSDDIGVLVDSFNRMTGHLSEARDASIKSQQQLEKQRTYLHTVLANISSGVISVNQSLQIKTVNQAAADMIGTSTKLLVDRLLSDPSHASVVNQLYELVKSHIEDKDQTWTQQLSFLADNEYKYLICRGTRIIDGGYVIVLNDITQIVQAQRETAWGEVARHLAHEIKNPLTPIQLSAEQLSKKLADKVTADEADLLQRATHTIIEQVKSMKEMVDEFSQYSRPAPPQFEEVDVNQLVMDIVELYRSGKHKIQLDLSARNLLVSGDKSRLRQLLHNLLKNASEALDNCDWDGVISIVTHSHEDKPEKVEIEVQDNGPGFSDAVIKRLFEPYSTTKPKGKGLGLAIVKKIVEEHNGTIQILNLENGGAVVKVALWYVEALKENTNE